MVKGENMHNMRTWAQRDRQRSRESDGRYTIHNPCYRCGKSAGTEYYSGKYVDRDDENGRHWGDELLCICRACESYLHKLDLQGLYEEVSNMNWGNLPKGKK